MGKKERHEGAPKGRRCCGGGSPEDCQEVTDRRTRCVSCDTKARRSQLDHNQMCLECAAMVRCEGEPIPGLRCKRFRPADQLTYGLCDTCLAAALGMIPSLLDEATWVTPLEPPDDDPFWSA